MLVPDNVLLGGIARLGVQYRNKQSVDMDCQSLFIAPLDLTRLKQMWAMVIPIVQLHHHRVSTVVT